MCSRRILLSTCIFWASGLLLIFHLNGTVSLLWQRKNRVKDKMHLVQKRYEDLKKIQMIVLVKIYGYNVVHHCSCKWNSCKPVSYTHLDVYKRQIVLCVIVVQLTHGLCLGAKLLFHKMFLGEGQWKPFYHAKP